MIIYILKTILCSSLLYVVYHFFLEKESMHKFKRFYLLFAIAFSLIVPAMTLNILPATKQAEIIQNIEIEIEYVVSLENVITNSITPDSEINQNKETQQLLIGLSFYFLITSILFVRYIFNLGRIIYTSNTKKNIILQKQKLILIDNLQVPYSFWNTIFLNKADYENNTIEDEILTHELTHAEQKHTADILFIELLLTILWFNPTLYLYRRAIKLNHEFLADQTVVKGLDQVSHYQQLLIEKVGKGNLSLASNFNYLITKKRLIMMTKTTSKKKALSYLLLMIPMLLISTLSFCKKDVASVGLDAITKLNTIPQQETTEQGVFEISGTITPGEGVTQIVMDKCAEITNKYIEKKSDENVVWKTYTISKDDEDYLYTTYIQMNDDQRKSQSIHYLSPLTPMRLRSPNNDEWKAATNKLNDEIWLDGKLVEITDLKSYTRSDITFFLCKRSIQKGDGRVIQRADLWTKQGYDNFIRQYAEKISTAELLKIPPVSAFVTRKDNKPRTH